MPEERARERWLHPRGDARGITRRAESQLRRTRARNQKAALSHSQSFELLAGPRDPFSDSAGMTDPPLDSRSFLLVLIRMMECAGAATVRA